MAVGDRPLAKYCAISYQVGNDCACEVRIVRAHIFIKLIPRREVIHYKWDARGFGFVGYLWDDSRSCALDCQTVDALGYKVLDVLQLFIRIVIVAGAACRHAQRVQRVFAFITV